MDTVADRELGKVKRVRIEARIVEDTLVRMRVEAAKKGISYGELLDKLVQERLPAVEAAA